MGNECCVLNEYFLFSFCDFLMIFHKFFMRYMSMQ